MTMRRMTLDEAIDLLKNNYEVAQTYEYIRDPLAWALYTTWKGVDERRKKHEA